MSASNKQDIGGYYRTHGANGARSGVENSQRPFTAQDQTTHENELPAIISARKLVEENWALPEEVVKGLLHKGSKMVLGGGSKSFKTWCLADLALCVANGVPWWGLDTNKGRVLYINFEIQNAFFGKRLDSIFAAKGMGFEALDNLNVWNLRGYCTDLSTLMTTMLETIPKNHYSLIVVDPIYKGLGNRDENSAGNINSLLNEIERLAVDSGAAVVFGAHFSKGNQAAKESIDRISGSGVFARDPDSILIMTKHENEYTYTVEPTLRNFAPMEPFCVRWSHPLMVLDEKADPNRLKVPGNKTSRFNSDQLLEVLGEEEQFTMEWYMSTAHRYDMSKSTFLNYLGKIKNDTTKVIQTAEGKWKAVNPVLIGLTPTESI